MDLFEDPAPQPSNQPEYTVSELSGAVKRVIEGEFGLVRVRGEVGRVSRPASGHLYFDLKDDRSVIAAISWKGQVAKMQVRPEEGMEVVATGRMTTFPGQSKYQLIVDDVAPAGAGALMAMLEKRRAALQAEGLFDPARKKPIRVSAANTGLCRRLSFAVGPERDHVGRAGPGRDGGLGGWRDVLAGSSVSGRQQPTRGRGLCPTDRHA